MPSGLPLVHLHPASVVEPGGMSMAPALVRDRLSPTRKGKLWCKVCLHPHLEQGGTPLVERWWFKGNLSPHPQISAYEIKVKSLFHIQPDELNPDWFISDHNVSILPFYTMVSCLGFMPHSTRSCTYIFYPVIHLPSKPHPPTLNAVFTFRKRKTRKASRQ